MTTWTIIRHGLLLDIAAHRADPTDLLLEGPIIREIGPPPLAAPEDARVIDATDRLLMPGLVNAHTHSHGALAKGMVSDRVTLESFLVALPSMTGGRYLEEKFLSAQLCAIELVRKGCTAAFDMFGEFPAPSVDGVLAVARAYQTVGLRAVIAPLMADRTLWQALPGLLESLPDSIRADVERLRAAPKEASLETCRTLLRTWPFDHTLLRPALGPTIPLHCTDEFLMGCRDLASAHGIRVQTHLAESRTQALLGPKKYGGETLTAHLARLGLVDERFSGAHAIWLEADDIARLSDAGASIAHNPLSNLRLGSGVAPVRRMRHRGLRVGIGTDSVSTSDTQNMFEATRLASYLSRIISIAPTDWLRADEALEMATVGSAAILGMDDSIGQIAPGYRADILFLDLGHVNYVPLNDIVLQIVNGESGAAIDKVMIDGRMILEHNRMLTVDESKVRADVERAVERLRDVNAQAAAFARSVERYVGSFCIAHLCQPRPADQPMLHAPEVPGSCA